MEKYDFFSSFDLNFQGLLIHKHTLKEIYENFNVFQKATSILTIDILSIKEFYSKINLPTELLENLTVLDFLCQQCSNSFFLLELESAFLTYTKRTIKIDKNKIILIAPNQKDFILDENNFDEFQTIIRVLNKQEDYEEEPEIITDNLKMKEKFEKARRQRKLAKAKERREKNKDEDNIVSWSNIIRNLCVYNIGYNLDNVWSLTIFQLLELYKTCQNKEFYHNSLAAALAGAKVKQSDLTHWTMK